MNNLLFIIYVGGLIGNVTYEKDGLMSSNDYINIAQSIQAASLQLVKLGTGNIYIVDIVFFINQLGFARYALSRDSSGLKTCKKIYNTTSDSNIKFFTDSSDNFYVQPANSVGVKVQSVYSTSVFINTMETNTDGFSELSQS